MDYQKVLKRVTLFLPSNPVRFNGQDYDKQMRPGPSDPSLIRLQNKSFISDALPTCNVKRFLSYSKN